MTKQEIIQSHHRNYLSKIRGNNDKLLEYICKIGEILTQYYFSDDDQKKATLLHQYRILVGISKSVNNPKLCKNCKNEKKKTKTKKKKNKKKKTLLIQKAVMFV